MATELSRNHQERPWQQLLSRLLPVVMRSTAQGATTQVWLAAADQGDVEAMRGQYVANRLAQALPSFAKDEGAAARLWKESEERAGFQFELHQQDEGNESINLGALDDAEHVPVEAN